MTQATTPAAADALTPAAVAAVESRIRQYVRCTPVISIDRAEFGLPAGPLTLKLEFLQHSGSFKVRGAFANLLLRDPVLHFPPQRDGDLVEDGVCVMFIAEKLGVAAPTATRHLQVLARAGLVTSRRIGQWTFYQRAADPMDLIEREFGGGQ